MKNFINRALLAKKHLKLFFALFAMLALGVGNAWGALTEEYSYTFIAKQFSDNTTAKKLGSVTWTPATTWNVGTGYWGYDGTKGQQWGSGSNTLNKMILTSGTSFSNVKKIEINASIASSGGCKLSVKVGNTTIGTTKTLTTTATAYTFEDANGLAGAVEITLSNGSKKKAQYIKSIKIYTESSAPEKVLSSIEISGDLTKKTYEEGEELDLAGLTVTAKYDDNSEEDVTKDVEWSYTPNPLTKETTSSTVTATYEGKTATKIINGLTVNEHIITPGEYCITPNNKFWGTNFSGSITGDALNQTYIGRQDDITIQYAKGSGSNLYINDSQTRTYSGTTLTFSVPSGYLITAIAFTADGNNWDGTHTANAGSMTDSKNWAGSANEVTITFGGTCRITNICVTYEAIDLTLPSAPTFTPAAGTYNAVQNVTISAEAGTTIYYTLDGTEPTKASAVYSTPIEIAETKTLKAIAVKDEKVSPIASAKYTINLPLTTMDQIFAKATAVGSTATPVKVTMNNWVVTGVKGSNAYLTDGTKGLIIYTASHGFVVGDVLSGTVACKVQLYNGSSELTELTKTTEGLTVTTGGTVTPVEVDDVNTLGGVNTGSVIKITGTCESGNVVAGVKLYGTLYTFDNLTVGNKYNVTGVYLQYGDVEEILPRKQEDIEEVVGLPTATISIADITMEVGETKTIEATITPDAAQSTVQYAITSGNEYITLSGTTITAVDAGTATITATIAEVAGVYNGATKTFTVTVKPQNIAILPFTFNGGKADIENTLGMSQTGLDNDYGSAPKLKFNDAGDNVIIHFDSQAGEFSFLLKQNGQNAGTFTVYESANGEDYTPVWSGGDFGNAQSETIKPTLSESARYVKFEYTTKGNSTNYALGSISIAKPDLRQEAGLVWNPSAVTLTQGDAFTAPTLNNPYSVEGITYESNNTNVATVTDAGIISLAEATGEATITASFAGNENYKPITVTCIITVSAPPYRVTWLVNGKLLTDAELSDASTYVYEGESITKTPPAPNPEDFCGQVFVGWTDAENGEYVHGTSNLYATPLEFPTASADQIFYAVFADYEQQ